MFYKTCFKLLDSFGQFYKTMLVPGMLFQRCTRAETETVIQHAQNSSECVNLDAQIMILDAQSRSIGVQLDLKNFVSNLANEIQASASK